MKKNTLIGVSDLTHTPRAKSENDLDQLTSNYQLTYEETKKREKTNNKAQEELNNYKKKANNDFGSAIDRFFGDNLPEYFITLTFKDKRIVSGINVGHRIDIEAEYDGYIPKHQINYVVKDHAMSVGVQRTTKAIEEFFYKGMYNYTKSKRNKNKKITKTVIRSKPLCEIANKFVYVVELGSHGQRRHIHLLLNIKGTPKEKIYKLNTLALIKNIHLWERDQGFTDVTVVNSVNAKEKMEYISKQQYIAKSFNNDQFENYSELFGTYDYEKEFNDIRDVFLTSSKKNKDSFGYGHNDVTQQQILLKGNNNGSY